MRVSYAPPAKVQMFYTHWENRKNCDFYRGDTHKDVSGISVSSYRNYDQEEHNNVNCLRKDEEKIVSSTTVVATNIMTLIHHVVRIYVGRTI